MGLFDIIKSITTLFKIDKPMPDDLLPEERALLEKISILNAKDIDITPELYQQLREYEENWLERHYDFNSIEGVNSIPVREDLPSAPPPQCGFNSHTSEVYYYLRRKAYQHEEAGNINLALACMQKSVSLVKCRSYVSSNDLLPLVKMLARAGRIKDAYTELRAAEAYFATSLECDCDIKAEIRRGHELRDFSWLQANIPGKCPKSISGYRRMKTQNTKNFQVLKALAAEMGREI